MDLFIPELQIYQPECIDLLIPELQILQPRYTIDL